MDYVRRCSRYPIKWGFGGVGVREFIVAAILWLSTAVGVLALSLYDEGLLSNPTDNFVILACLLMVNFALLLRLVLMVFAVLVGLIFRGNLRPNFISRFLNSYPAKFWRRPFVGKAVIWGGVVAACYIIFYLSAKIMMSEELKYLVDSRYFQATLYTTLFISFMLLIFLVVLGLANLSTRPFAARYLTGLGLFNLSIYAFLIIYSADQEFSGKPLSDILTYAMVVLFLVVPLFFFVWSLVGLSRLRKFRGVLDRGKLVFLSMFCVASIILAAYVPIVGFDNLVFSNTLFVPPIEAGVDGSQMAYLTVLVDQTMRGVFFDVMEVHGLQLTEHRPNVKVIWFAGIFTIYRILISTFVTAIILRALGFRRSRPSSA